MPRLLLARLAVFVVGAVLVHAAVLEWTAVKALAAAPPPVSEHRDLLLKIAGGNCPRIVGLTLRTRQYEGGGEFTFVADVENFALPPVRSKRAPGEIVFSGQISPPFQTCVATARTEWNGSRIAFAWTHDRWRYSLRPDRELQTMRVRVDGSNPTVVLAVAD